ncbi:MAG: protease modulator HflC [Treponema sp.]|jgi:membrane protease subunit HflC|nr:protease modulator HflC [Treponema sp.]
MKKVLTVFIVLLVIVIGILIMGPFYVLDEGEQAVIVQLGRITNVVTEAGLHIKVPFIDVVERYPKKIMSWDGEQKGIPTREKQYIQVDVTARWRISDPEKFYASVRTIEAARLKLAEVIDSEVKTVVAENYFNESVRNSNIIMERQSSADDLGISADLDVGIISSAIQTEVNYEPITRGRRQLAAEILTRSRRMVPEYGIELIDIVTRHIRYNDELTQSVYARMIKERNQIAQAIRSEGEGRKAELLGQMDRERMTLLSEAYEKAEAIKGAADALATRIYAEAYGRDRDFFDFWRAIESYRTILPRFDMTITTDMEYFRYLYSTTGR